MAETSGNSDSVQDVFSKTQQQLFEQWRTNLEAFQKALQTDGRLQENSDNVERALDFYDSWKENTAKYLDIWMSAHPGSANTDVFAKLFGAADVYTRLYEFWGPLAKALQERSLEAQSYQDLFDAAKYRDAIDGMFGFGSSATATNLYGDTSKLFETWAARGQEFLKPWTDAMRTSTEAGLAAASGDSQASVEAFRSLYSAFDQTFGKALTMPAVGKDREHTELLSRAIDRYAVFLAKTAELQRQVHTISEQAMDKVVEAMAQRIKDGEQLTGYSEFVQIWTSINEKAFLDFFRTDEYSELQGLVLDAALDSRREFQQLAELSLKEYPIALRSEFDDVCKTIYSLNKSVRALKKKSLQLDELRSEFKTLQKRVAALEEQLSATGEQEDEQQDEQ